jgi:hypothetical protein
VSVKFTVNVYCGPTKILEIPNMMLIDGRIQIPERRHKIPSGEIRVKVVKPLFVLLKAIWDEISDSNWWNQWPGLPPLIPLVQRDEQ